MKAKFKKLPGDRVLIAILVALSSFAAHSLLRSGHPRLGDTWAHLARTKIVYDALAHLTIPYWDFKIYYGFPFLKFYAPLYYYLAALFAFFSGGDVVLGTKIFLFICHVLSAVTMFAFIRRYLQNSGAAFVGGLAYAYTFWHLYQILAMNRYPVALIYVWAPLCFWATYNFSQEQKLKESLLMGLTWGIALLIHPQYGIFTIIISFVFILPYLRGLKYIYLIWATVFAMGISGHSIIPFILEGQKYLNPFSSEKYVKVSLMALLEWSKDVNRSGNWLKGEYLGLSIILLSLIGLIYSWKNTSKNNAIIIGGFILCLLFTFGLSISFFEPFYRLFGMMPKRFLIFLVIFLSILAADGYLLIVKKFKIPLLVLIITSIIILVDLVPTAIQKRCYPPKDFVMRKRNLVYENTQPRKFIADLGTADSNAFDFGRLLYYPGMQSLYSKNPSPYGYYYQFAPKTILYSYPWLNMLAQTQATTRNDSVSALNNKIGELLNITYVIYDDKIQGTGLGSFENISPIITSNAIQPWHSSGTALVGQYCYADDYKQLFDSTKIELKTATAAKLWISGGEAKILAGYVPAKPNVTQFDLNQNTAQITVETQSPCFARIPLSYYPDIKIYINGVSCPKVYESADHFMIVQLDKGVSKIDVIPTRSAIEKASLILSGICLLAVCGGLYKEKKNRKRLSALSK